MYSTPPTDADETDVEQAIEWYKLSDLPTLKKHKHIQQGQVQNPQGQEVLKDSMFYMVAPFLGPLKGWIKQQRKLDKVKQAKGQALNIPLATAEVVEHVDVNIVPEQMPQIAPDAHFDRLLANLRRSEQLPEITKVPEAASDSGTIDSAAELKRLLNVGMGFPKPFQETMPFRSSDVKILDDKGILSSSQHNLSQAQLDQNTRTPFQSHPSHHEQSHLDVFPQPQISPAPRFEMSPMMTPKVTQYSGRNVPKQSRESISPLVGDRRQLQQPSLGETQFLMSQPMASRFLQQHRQSPVNPQFNVHGPAIPQSIQKPSMFRPYQQTGDPFARNTQFPDAHGPAIPEPSKLPAPRLNAHTMNLLNTFKGNASASHAKYTDLYKKGIPQPKQETEVEALLAARSPKTEASPAQVVNQHRVQVTAPKPRSAHQDSLLNLFRAPSTSAASPLRALQTQGALAPPAGEPVELSAHPSPGLKRTHEKIPAEQVLLQRNSYEPKAGLTSATVSGPLNSPDFETIKRNNPIDIHGNPIIRSSSAASGGKMHDHGITQPLSAQPQPQPFKPTILARPKVPHAPSPGTKFFDRRDTLPTEQKDMLLSLFGKPAQPNTPNVMSPVSPLPEKASLHQTPQENRSRISSIASVSAGEPAPPAIQKVKDVPPKQKSPVTPVDKSFLLGFLNDVAKKGN
jgi:mRNA-decapping enzyme subunit 2